MKASIFSEGLRGSRGFTLLEILISFVIFSIVIFSSVYVFRKTLLRFSIDSGEKKTFSEITTVFNYIERYLPAAMSDKDMQIHFRGESDIIRFAAPFSEGSGSDIALFSFYFNVDSVKVAVRRVSRENPGFDFPQNFSGAQVLAENIGTFEFEYFDGAGWAKSWDTYLMAEPELPRYVRVTVGAYSSKIEGERIEKQMSRIIKVGM